MKIPQTFLTENKKLEGKIKELTEGYLKKESHIEELELLKTGRTREEKKGFLKLFAEHIQDFIEEVREKMIRTKTETVYLKKQIVEDYSARLEISIDSHLEFHHQIYKADLDDKEFYSYNGYATLFDHLNTYPDKENIYYNYAGDVLNSSYEAGKEMYECIREFLAKNRFIKN